jgi:hypothetical protein
MRRIILGIAMFLTSLWGPMELRAESAGASAPAFELVTFAGESYSNVSLLARGSADVAGLLGALVQGVSA